MTSRATGNGQGSRDSVPSPAGCTPAEPSSGSGPLRRTIHIVNPLGLHWRVAERFSRIAKTFSSAVRVSNGESRADGKSPTDLILLVALPGSDLILEVDGADALVALERLAEILAAPGGEDYAI